MANTKQPVLKEPGPSDNQLIDYKKSNVRFVLFFFVFYYIENIFI
jgi:hypothetical protein